MRNPSEANFYVQGFDGLLNAYRRARLEVMPYAPTEFADAIYHISKLVEIRYSRIDKTIQIIFFL